MASTTMEIRQAQKASLEKELAGRLAALKTRGLDEKDIAKDPVLKNLCARMKQANGRIAAIEKKARRTEDLARIKAEKAAQPKEQPEEKPEKKPEKKAKAEKSAAKEKAETTDAKEKAPKKKKKEAEPKTEA
jgi:hypothetical protein